MSFCWSLLFFFACAYCAVSPNAEEYKCTTVDCEYLYYNFVKHVEEFGGSPCESVHAYVCDKRGIDVKDYVENEYRHLMNNVSSILSSDSSGYGGEAIQLERNLYKQCMKLGGSESQFAQEQINGTLSFLRDMEIRSTSGDSWQLVDDEIASENFGRAFFDVGVVQDPDNLEQNVIMISPPSLTSLFNTYAMFNETSRNTRLYDYIHTHSIHPLLFGFFGVDRVVPLKNFFASLFKAAGHYLYGIPKDFEDNQNYKLSLREWTSEFNRHKSDDDKTYINWEKIIQDAFKAVQIDVQPNDPIIVKNHPYFNELFQILLRTDNKIIGLAVVMKALADNFRYVNWNFAVLFNRVDKRTFCLNETKLYGTSYEILSAFKGDRWKNQVYDTEQTYEIFNIVNSFQDAIYRSAFLNPKEQDYLSNELDVMTANILKNKVTRNTIFYDYNSFEPSYSYIKNINNYRRMLKYKELSTLRLHPETSTKYPLFSLVDLVQPSNRFTINALFTGGELPKHFVPKQVYYGFYGVRMASLAYGLLNENKYHDVSYVYLNRSKIFEFYEYDFDKLSHVFFDSVATLDPNPDYHLDKMQCFLPELDHKVVLEKTRALESMISDAYGFQLAYEVMMKIDSNESAPFTKQNLNRLSQFFYLAYVKSHCKTRPEYTNAVVFNSPNFTENFPMCAQEYNVCQMKPFEHISKNIFLV